MSVSKNQYSNLQSSNRWRLVSLSLLSLIGLTLSVILTFHFYEIRGIGGHFKSACNLGSSINCDLVAASRSAELFAGYPLSSFAAGWFLTFFIVSLFNFQKYWRREAIRATFGLSFIGVLISGYYLWMMKFKLHTLCLYCLGLDLCLLVAFLISISLKPERPWSNPFDRSKWMTFLGIGLGSHLAMVVALSWQDQNELRSADIKEAADSILASTATQVQIDESSPNIGPKDAPITIVEFSDFQCPFCRIGALTINELLYRYPGKVRIVFKNYPLDQKCNSEFPQTMHPSACEAARNALCAHEQGKFQEAYEALFEKQGSLAEGRVAGLLNELNLDTSRLSVCAEAPQTALQITRDITEGKALGISGTPTFFVNGHRVEGIRPSPIWNLVIERLLQPSTP